MYRIRRAHLNDCPALAEIWEEAVSSTHDFLSSKDYEFYKVKLRGYFDHINLYLLEYTNNGNIAGFAGVKGDTLEMLFVRERGQGVGKALMDFAVKEKYITKVDVNSQNTRAVAFYKKYGFKEIGESPVDGEGKPYPITHMAIEPTRPAMPHGHIHSHGHPGGHGGHR